MKSDFRLLDRSQIQSLTPQQPPFLFLDVAEIGDGSAWGRYKIPNQQLVFDGHFRENPVFPASLSIEALGQLGVLYLLASTNTETKAVDPKSIYFTSCDGIKCRRICRPGDELEMKIQVKRIRHPLFYFQGSISVGGEHSASAESITLTFDFSQ